MRLLILVLLLLFAPGPVAAVQCLPLDAAIEVATDYDERPIGTARLRSAAMLLYVNRDSGSFTVLLIPDDRPDIACVAITGGDWRDRVVPARPTGDPS